MEGIQQKPLAVVTGASSGIGFELAGVFGEEGFDLIARQGFEALMAGEERVGGGGLKNKAQVAASKVIPGTAEEDGT